jgi:hypothetical protein
MLVSSTRDSTMGINYSDAVDNIPLDFKLVQLIKSQGIDELKLYDIDVKTLHAFSGTIIKINIYIPNKKLY